MAPPTRRTSSTTNKPLPPPLIKETSKVSLFGTSKPSSSSSASTKKTASSITAGKRQAELKKQGEDQLKREFKQVYGKLLKESEIAMGKPSHPLEPVEIVLR